MNIANDFLRKCEENIDIFIEVKNTFEVYTKNEKSYILENYLVNEYFREFMPFTKDYKSCVAYSLISLLTRYTFIQMLALSHIDKNGVLKDEELLRIIYLVSRNFSHNSKFTSYILEVVSELELNTIAGIFLKITKKATI